jgi:predicted peptidase
MIRSISFLALVIMSLVVKAQNSPGELFDKLKYSNGSSTLPYRFLKPVNPDSFESFPLVIFLHGAGERGVDNEAQLKHILHLFTSPTNRGKFPCYVLVPQCPKQMWWVEHNRDGSMKSSPTETMQLVSELIEKISTENKVDRSRIYITGVSMGAFAVWDILARYPNKFAAAIPICGGADVSIAPIIKDVPQWIFHGAKDTIVNPNQSRKMVKALQSAGGTPGYTEYPDVAHDSWIQAYQEPHLLPWLFKQKLPGQTPSSH